MDPFRIIILVCAISTSHADCQRKTAIDVINGPSAKNEIECGLFGQSTLAFTALTPRVGVEYVKIMCEPRRR